MYFCLMRVIILFTFFLAPLFGLASFPIQISIPSDTTIETKKETMEEYKIRIQKQLYNQETNNEINNYKPLRMLDGFFLLLGLISIVIAVQVANNSTKFLAGLGWFYLGILSLGLSILIFLFKQIRKAIKKRK